jgi:hypothetical protein
MKRYLKRFFTILGVLLLVKVGFYLVLALNGSSDMPNVFF